MPPPALSVMRRSQQPLDNAVESVRPGVGKERVDVGGFGGQTRQVERGTSNQGSATGGFRRGKPALLELIQHKKIQRRAGPRAVSHARKRGLAHWLQRPVRLPGVGRLDRRRRRGLGRPGCAQVDPGFDRGDRLGGQLAVGRHFDFILVAQRLHQQAALRVARGNRRSAVAAANRGGARVEPQTSLLFFAVTLQTMLGEERANMPLEILDALGRRRGRGRLVGGGCSG